MNHSELVFIFRALDNFIFLSLAINYFYFKRTKKLSKYFTVIENLEKSIKKKKKYFVSFLIKKMNILDFS